MANELKADAILVFTRRGSMARYTGWMRPRCSQIFCALRNKDVAEGLSMSWGRKPRVWFPLITTILKRQSNSL